MRRQLTNLVLQFFQPPLKKAPRGFLPREAQRPLVRDAGLDGFPKASYDAEHATIPIGIDDPTNGFYAQTAYTKGAVADIAWNDGIRDIITSRRPFSDYDTVTKEWASAAGDQVRKEYTDAMASAKT